MLLLLLRLLLLLWLRLLLRVWFLPWQVRLRGRPRRCCPSRGCVGARRWAGREDPETDSPGWQGRLPR